MKKWLIAVCLICLLLLVLSVLMASATVLEVSQMTEVRGGCSWDCITWNCRWPVQFSGCQGTLIDCAPEVQNDCSGVDATDYVVDDCQSKDPPLTSPCTQGGELPCAPIWSCKCFFMPGINKYVCSGADSDVVYALDYQKCNLQ